MVQSTDVEAIVSDLQFVRGNESGLFIRKKISHPLDIWLLGFDEKTVNEEVLLSVIRNHPATALAQFNHLVTQRATLPNDSLINRQWQYNNTGAGGGRPDADIDADDAWDITTGGVTALGDTIVVCIIDDGLDLQHSDFGGNLWVNGGEIPNNGMDDDGNGYIDDYLGWNAYSDNDDIGDMGFGGGHGTPVAGIVGARGNNGTGVSGVNWQVKLMIVVGGGDEAEALEAYSYPLEMRMRYNQSQGASGAYVVATNASWGTDFGQPDEAPLWCAMYDTLGKYGVLNAGATINDEVDVDVMGDLPTGCPSDYLISVTNTNRNDNKIRFAGYGAISVDLGAPGEGTFTTDYGNDYGPFGGTSGATPHVAGSVALLFSAPCSAFAQVARDYPEYTALFIKEKIMRGVDPLPSLQGITVTGGRLNVNNSLLDLMSECSDLQCPKPLAMDLKRVGGDDYIVSWFGVGATSYHLRYRAVGDTVWTDRTQLLNDAVLVNGLPVCTEMEFQVAGICDTTSGNFTRSFTFMTDGCCKIPENLTATVDSNLVALLSWDSVYFAAQSYNIEFRNAKDPNWNLVPGITQIPFRIPGLPACTKFEFRVQALCDTALTPFSDIYEFESGGCGDCATLNYCLGSIVDASLEWIERVEIGTIDNTSGPDGGYGRHFTESTVLDGGQTYPMSLTPGYFDFFYNEYFQVWVDFNRDGDFEDLDEYVYNGTSPTTTTLKISISVPIHLNPGRSRMRVMMLDSIKTMPCGDYAFGEIEDYCVDLTGGNSGIGDLFNPISLTVFPNPTSGRLTLATDQKLDEFHTMELIDVMGKKLIISQMSVGEKKWKVSLNKLPQGIYFLQVIDQKGRLRAVKKVVKN